MQQEIPLYFPKPTTNANMLPEELHQHLSQENDLGSHLSYQPVGGGCINRTGVLRTSSGSYFLKWNQRVYPGMFEAEAEGLRALAQTHTLRVPKPKKAGQTANFSYLWMEEIRPGTRASNYWVQLGEKLAMLHRTTQPHFGWHSSNYIGSLPQENTPADNWITFFIDSRLRPLLKLAMDSQKLTTTVVQHFERLYRELPQLFPSEPPALLHGDLWSGNVMVDDLGAPVVVDPAVYFGHREMDIAFSRLFGGFDERFYHAYHNTFPQSPGFAEREDIYNLYPLLVHVNLFGGGYVHSVEQIVRRF